MALDLTSLSTDEEKEKDGVWHPYLQGSRLLIARAGNQQAENLRFELAQPHLAELQAGGEKALEIMREIDLRVLSQAILKGWEGIRIGEETIEYDADTAYALLSDRRLKDFRRDVEKLADRRDRYAAEGELLVEKAVKKAAAS